MRESDKMQVNWHYISWPDFNEMKGMIERADANAGVVYDKPKPRDHRHVVRKRVRDAHLIH